MSPAELIQFPVVAVPELSRAVDDLAAIQKEAAELLRRERELRSKIRDGMSAAKLDTFTSATGHRATIVTSTTFKGDRKAALKLLSPNVVAEIFKPVEPSICGDSCGRRRMAHDHSTRRPRGVYDDHRSQFPAPSRDLPRP